jgi:hypothetical protein
MNEGPDDDGDDDSLRMIEEESIEDLDLKVPIVEKKEEKVVHKEEAKKEEAKEEPKVEPMVEPV